MTVTRQPTTLDQQDHHLVSYTFRRSANRHMHLDWRTFEQWLGEPNLQARVIRVNDAVQALIGVTLHHHPTGAAGSPAAWLRFMLPPRHMDTTVLDALWYALREDLAEQGVRQMACLILQPWVEPLITRWGFTKVNAIVTLRRMGYLGLPEQRDDLHLRAGTVADIPAVVQVDAAAFEPLWAYSEETLHLAQREAVSFSVIEQDGEIVGYQLSTDHYSSGHLARLAVRPGLQGRGYGGALVGDMLHHFDQKRMRMVTVNTQEDNIRSRRLYSRLGFEYTGPDVPVYLLDL